MKETILILRDAQMAATFAHAGQRYDGKYDYIYHIDYVVSILRRFTICNIAVLTAAYLHDVIEDTPVSLKMIVEHFGEEVAKLVYAVSDERGINRKDKHLKTYPKILAEPNAIFLKLADRIANVEHSKNHKSDNKFDMYIKEYDLFRAILYNPSFFAFNKTDTAIYINMWKYLDQLMREK